LFFLAAELEASTMRLIFLTLIFLIAIDTKAQDGRYLDREFQLELDNDAYTLDVYLDAYYSQGIFARYRVVDTTKSIKKIKSISFNHRIFTPSSIGLTEVELFDRPYAGTLSVTGTITEFTPHNVIEYSLELGGMGKYSLAKPIQTEWHKWFGFGEPQGWDYQINDAPIINGYFKYAHLLVRAGSLQIISESNVAAGTTFTFVRQEVMVRIGKFKPLNESVSFGANLGHKKKRSKITQETIVFIAFGPEYVAHNSTIEGNFIGKKSEHTVQRFPWVTQFRVGALFAWSSFDISVLYYQRSIENVGAKSHPWVGVKLSQRI